MLTKANYKILFLIDQTKFKLYRRESDMPPCKSWSQKVFYLKSTSFILKMHNLSNHSYMICQQPPR